MRSEGEFFKKDLGTHLIAFHIHFYVLRDYYVVVFQSFAFE
jgi:hypothetical protein